MIHLIHGFNVTDGGKKSVGRLRRFLKNSALHNYGWVGPFLLRFKNKETVEELLPKIREGDVCVGHSNGALICYNLVERGAPVSKVVLIQPALRRDSKWPVDVEVLCVWNPKDWAVSLGRVWSGIVSLLTPGRHGWGAAGRHGLDQKTPNITQWNTADGQWKVTAKGHSTILTNDRCLRYWGPKIAEWIEKGAKK